MHPTAAKKFATCCSSNRPSRNSSFAGRPDAWIFDTASTKLSTGSPFTLNRHKPTASCGKRVAWLSSRMALIHGWPCSESLANDRPSDPGSVNTTWNAVPGGTTSCSTISLIRSVLELEWSSTSSIAAVSTPEFLARSFNAESSQLCSSSANLVDGFSRRTIKFITAALISSASSAASKASSSMPQARALFLSADNFITANSVAKALTAGLSSMNTFVLARKSTSSLASFISLSSSSHVDGLYPAFTNSSTIVPAPAGFTPRLAKNACTSTTARPAYSPSGSLWATTLVTNGSKSSLFSISSSSVIHVWDSYPALTKAAITLIYACCIPILLKKLCTSRSGSDSVSSNATLLKNAPSSPRACISSSSSTQVDGKTPAASNASTTSDVRIAMPAVSRNLSTSCFAASQFCSSTMSRKTSVTGRPACLSFAIASAKLPAASPLMLSKTSPTFSCGNSAA